MSVLIAILGWLSTKQDLVALRMRCFVRVFDADLVKIFFPFQQLALKSNYYQIFAKNGLAKSKQLPNSTRCQNQCNAKSMQ
jgi:hypothetical protein